MAQQSWSWPELEVMMEEVTCKQQLELEKLGCKDCKVYNYLTL